MTNREKIFISEYLKCWNGAEAARRAGYSVNSARQAAQKLLTKDYIQDTITAELKARQMGADEALNLLADQARGDIADVMDISGVGFMLDMAKAKEKGLTKLIKKVKQRTTTYQAKKESEEDREVNELEIELYDAQAAIDKILHIHGKFVDKHEISTGDGVIRVTIKGVDDE